MLFFLNNTATTEIYPNLNPLALHDALPLRYLPVVTGAHLILQHKS
eukprot:COSAG01_NODE_21001_length_923_cov_0.759709_2_plen_45_part_01